MSLTRYLLAVSLSLIVSGAAARAQAPVVHTSLGDLSGTDIAGIHDFKGVPYAQPPVGALRWRPPQPATAWTGTKDASRFGNDCVQKPLPSSRAPAVSEDCLTLNIWSPAAVERLPVMVWVYGGSFIDGSGSLPIYDGTELAKRGVIVITFNYRTGVFGFLAHRALAAESPNHSAGNYGILDTIEALRWVKQNTAAFGGDPGRVTIFGESSGASLLTLVMSSPLSAGLFQQAILQSPGAMRPMSTLQQAEPIADLAGPDAATLRSMPPAEVLALTNKIVPTVRRLTTPRALGPVLDGWVLPQTDTGAFAKGEMQKVPLIVGGNSDEGRVFVKDWPIHTQAEARDYATQNFGSSADEMLSLYGLKNEATIGSGLSYAFGDTQFNFGVRGVAQGMAAAQPKVWRYLFTHHPGGAPTTPTHSEEIDYVFGTLGAARYIPRGPMNADDHRLSDIMMATWVRFAQTGNPNGGSLPAWPEYMAQSDSYLAFGDPIAVGHGYRTQYLDFVGHFLADQAKQP